MRPNVVHASFEELNGIVICPSLGVLWQGDKCGTAIRRVKHRADSRRQRLDDLCWMRDPVPVPAHRPEGIIQAKGRIVEVFDLLQHGVGQPRQVRVSAKHQDGQPVGMGKGGAGKEVRGAGSGGCSAEHETPSQPRLCVARRGEPHPLLVLAAIERQRVLDVGESLAEAGDIAVAEDAESSSANPVFGAVYLDELAFEKTHDGLRHCQRHRSFSHTWPPCNSDVDRLRERTEKIRDLQPVATGNERAWACPS